ncbi:glycine cleavage system aminomethyltransferase T [Leptospira ryugenii]|uniref:Aminomethyltransferase n=1 Tax=Leptospira ryugenii TaxID=1917863 RepID=A0A2P2E3X4_9LEPT|nr:glycine cleavage system aminomethyltransferase T [Leptospira ryugenii]
MDLQKTALNEKHRQLGAKMVPFGGWDMPVQYTGIIQEHLSTRTDAGLFDVSHMGEIFITGASEDILSLLETLTCNTVSTMKDGQVQYNAVLNETGGLVDDVTIYKFSAEKYMICSNASNYPAVTKHLQKYQKGTCRVEDQSHIWHQLALQGPKANAILESVLKQSLDPIAYYHFQEITYKSETIIVSRTGYTGEDGFEIYTSVPLGLQLWDTLLQEGKSSGLVPVGLGARDTLRLEAKYPLYGHELNEEWSPVESGIGFIVKEKTLPYFGYERILSDKKNSPKRKIVGIQLEEPGVMRENYPIFAADETPIGKTTSGTHSPSCKVSLGLAILDFDYTKDQTEVFVEIRGQKKKAKVHLSPFIKGSVRNHKG